MRPFRALLAALCVVAGVGLAFVGGAVLRDDTMVWLGLAIYACAWGIALS